MVILLQIDRNNLERVTKKTPKINIQKSKKNQNSKYGQC